MFLPSLFQHSDITLLIIVVIVVGITFLPTFFIVSYIIKSKSSKSKIELKYIVIGLILQILGLIGFYLILSAIIAVFVNFAYRD